MSDSKRAAALYAAERENLAYAGLKGTFIDPIKNATYDHHGSLEGRENFFAKLHESVAVTKTAVWLHRRQEAHLPSGRWASFSR